MNSFFKQLLGSLVQIGINELSKKTNVGLQNNPTVSKTDSSPPVVNTESLEGKTNYTKSSTKN